MIKLQLLIYFVLSSSINTLDFYDYTMDSPQYKKRDLRRIFLNKKRMQRVTEKRISMLEKNSTNEALYFEGIPHFKSNDTSKGWNKIKKIEKNFKLMIAMKGVKYNYKRGMHWRTWREVVYPNKTKRVYCYRCDNFVNTTCDNCNKSALWVIEENPPCPYEFFEVENKYKICGINYIRINKINKNCPEIYTLNDLPNCDNPIETKYHIIKDYATVSTRNKTVICGKEDFCVISTTYAISSDQIVFRIMNATNTIIFSKIMKFDGNKFYCIEQCGQIDPVTKKVTKHEAPLVVDLLNTRNKKKRENLWSDLEDGGKSGKKAGNENNGIPSDTIKINRTLLENPRFMNMMEYVGTEYRDKTVPSTMSECMKIRTKDLSNYDDFEEELSRT